MAALQLLAIPSGIAAVCALPCPEIHRFHFVQLFAGQATSCWARSGGGEIRVAALMVVAVVFGKRPPPKGNRLQLAKCPVTVFITS